MGSWLKTGATDVAGLPAVELVGCVVNCGLSSAPNRLATVGAASAADPLIGSTRGTPIGGFWEAPNGRLTRAGLCELDGSPNLVAMSTPVIFSTAVF